MNKCLKPSTLEGIRTCDLLFWRRTQNHYASAQKISFASNVMYAGIREDRHFLQPSFRVLEVAGGAQVQATLGQEDRDRDRRSTRGCPVCIPGRPG
jgi:hypothetical protein